MWKRVDVTVSCKRCGEVSPMAYALANGRFPGVYACPRDECVAEGDGKPGVAHRYREEVA